MHISHVFPNSPEFLIGFLTEDLGSERALARVTTVEVVILRWAIFVTLQPTTVQLQMTLY